TGPTRTRASTISTTPSTGSAYRAGVRAVDPRLDLDLCPERKRRDLDRGARRLVVAEGLGVDGVDHGEVAEVGDEHRRLGHVRELRSAVPEDGGDVGQDLAALRARITVDDRTGRRVDRNLA